MFCVSLQPAIHSSGCVQLINLVMLLGTSARYCAVVCSLRVNWSAFNLQRHWNGACGEARTRVAQITRHNDVDYVIAVHFCLGSSYIVSTHLPDFSGLSSAFSTSVFNCEAFTELGSCSLASFQARLPIESLVHNHFATHALRWYLARESNP